MDERAHLHEGERLLLRIQPSLSILLWSLLCGVLDGLLIGVILFLFILLVTALLGNTLSSPVVYGLLFILSYVAVAFWRWRGWQAASFRVTTERILLQFPGNFFSRPLTTIKWNRG